MSSSYFSANYTEARNKFVAAATKAGGEIRSILNPNATGPENEALYTDVALFGDRGASKALVVVSGTHGNEGFCGSGCQIGYLEEGFISQHADDTVVVVVHAINPYGFANIHRVNEDNVDLNRNFVDHNQPYPDNSPYATLHDYLLPEHWDPVSIKQANSALAAYG